MPSIFLQQENNASLLQREIVLLTISFPCLTGKNPLPPSKLSTFIQKGEMVGLPKVTFGLPNSSFPNAWLFSKVFHKMLHITKKWPILYEEGPTWASRNFFHVEASETMPSNAQGSKNWILISNLAAWFFMASILAALNWSWSSRSCTLIAEWSTLLLKI